MAVIYGHVHREQQPEKPPKIVQNIDDLDRVHQELRKNIKTKLEARFFTDIKEPEIKSEKNKEELPYVESSDELKTIDVLSKLSDDYHILCGVHIELSNNITYNGKKDLKSAQMDFIVISKRGVILLGVKNEIIPPHEQVDRAARVLMNSLKSWRNPKNPKVQSVALSVKGNISDDPKFKSVTVSNLDEINSFLENRPEEFSQQEIKRIVGRLKNHMTS